MNRDHEEESDVLTEGVALTLPARNSAGAAASILAFTEEELDRAAPVSLNGDAQCNRQFFLEKRNKQPKWLVVIADRPVPDHTLLALAQFFAGLINNEQLLATLSLSSRFLYQPPAETVPQ